MQSNQTDSGGHRFESTLQGDYRNTLSEDNFVFSTTSSVSATALALLATEHSVEILPVGAITVVRLPLYISA